MVITESTFLCLNEIMIYAILLMQLNMCGLKGKGGGE